MTVDLDKIETLARELCQNKRPGGKPTAVVGPWRFDDDVPEGYVNLWADQIPLARACHPETGRYLAALSPDVVLELVAEVRKAEAQRARVMEWLKEHGYGSCDTEDCDDSGHRPGGHKGGCMGVVEDILRGRAP